MAVHWPLLLTEVRIIPADKVLAELHDVFVYFFSLSYQSPVTETAAFLLSCSAQGTEEVEIRYADPLRAKNTHLSLGLLCDHVITVMAD